jgi:hypothetical protein
MRHDEQDDNITIMSPLGSVRTDITYNTNH